MKNKIYWAPCVDQYDEVDWSILYKDLTILHKSLAKKVDTSIIPGDNMIHCPAVRELTSKIAVIKSPMTCHYKLKDNNFIPTSKHHLATKKTHADNFKNNYLFTTPLSYIFFSESDINMTLSAPYFSESKHLQYGSLVPGRFNISKWFRNISIEFNLWTNVNEFKLKEDEPIAYVHFDSEEDIELVRFDFNEKLFKLMKSCATSNNWEKYVPFNKRYKRFKESMMHKLILKQIKENII
jgi:hypothetical protein